MLCIHTFHTAGASVRCCAGAGAGIEGKRSSIVTSSTDFMIKEQRDVCYSTICNALINVRVYAPKQRKIRMYYYRVTYAIFSSEICELNFSWW